MSRFQSVIDTFRTKQLQQGWNNDDIIPVIDMFKMLKKKGIITSDITEYYDEAPMSLKHRTGSDN